MNKFCELYDKIVDSGIVRTQQEFAEKVDISRPVISQLLSGKRELTEKHIRKISRAFPFINQNWLRTGEGEFGDINGLVLLSTVENNYRDYQLAGKRHGEESSENQAYLDELMRRASMYDQKVQEVNGLYNKLAEYSKSLAEKEKEVMELHSLILEKSEIIARLEHELSILAPLAKSAD